MFKRVKKNWNMLWPLLALTVVAVIIFLERMGVTENFLRGDQEIAQNERTRPTIEIPDTVLFVSRRESNSADFASEMEQILSDMRQSYEIVYVEDVEKEEFREQLAGYLGGTFADVTTRQKGNTYYKDFTITEETKELYAKEYGYEETEFLAG